MAFQERAVGVIQDVKIFIRDEVRGYSDEDLELTYKIAHDLATAEEKTAYLQKVERTQALRVVLSAAQPCLGFSNPRAAAELSVLHAIPQESTDHLAEVAKSDLKNWGILTGPGLNLA